MAPASMKKGLTSIQRNDFSGDPGHRGLEFEKILAYENTRVQDEA
jgi:hypothetical protein